MTTGYIATTGNYETYGGSLKIEESSKYKTKYAYSGTGEVDTTNYNESANISKIGDAVAEISSGGTGYTSWNGSSSVFLIKECPFFKRGDRWDGASSAGVFAFHQAYGYGQYGLGFRTVLIAE